MNEFFINNMKEILKNEYDDFMKALEKPSIKGFYLNPKRKEVIKYLDHQYIKQHPVVENGYIFDYENYPLGKFSYFNSGCYYIQEPSAMLVSHFLDVKEDDYVLDMCAAPGGKICYAASCLNENGLMIANDIDHKRSTILSSNVERFGFKNVIVTNNAPSAFERVLPEFFDKIILDAPCSGEGMFRKDNPAVETYSKEKVYECAHIQQELIDTAFKLLKPGGLLMYSTCTYNRIENEDQIEYMLRNYDCSLVDLPKSHGMSEGINIKEAVRLFPHRYEGEGHFMCLIKKNGESSHHKVKLLKSNITNESNKLVKDFYKQYLTIKVPKYLYESNHHIYEVNVNFPELKGIRIVRNGLYLGECKKNRFEPSLSLALALKKEDIKQYYTYHYDDLEIINYLKGEVIHGTNQKGYGIIFIEDYPLSFYKESNGQAKNLYPKGLRRNV